MLCNDVVMDTRAKSQMLPTVNGLLDCYIRFIYVSVVFEWSSNVSDSCLFVFCQWAYLCLYLLSPLPYK